MRYFWTQPLLFLNPAFLPSPNQLNFLITTLFGRLQVKTRLNPCLLVGEMLVFKLYAPSQTMIEGRIKNGVIEDLKAPPISLLSDVIVYGK